MRHGSLFSGIGGFDLAAEWMGWENVFQVEWDSYCQKVLTKNFPNVKRYGDIRRFDGNAYCGTIDIISGGFPCQPFSHAGKRKGTSDDRYLWPEMLRVIREVKPSFVVGENVAGLVSMENGKTLDRILSDLANEGYQTEQFIIPACGVGAWHRRDRIWIIAHSGNSANRTNGRKSREAEVVSCECGKKGLPRKFSGTGSQISITDTLYNGNSNRLDNRTNTEETEAGERTNIKERETLDRERFWNEFKSGSEDVSDTNNKRQQAGEECFKPSRQEWITRGSYEGARQWQSEPAVGRVANGIPNRMDRLKGLGNAIVPQVVYEIFKAIEQLNENILSLSQKYI